MTMHLLTEIHPEAGKIESPIERLRFTFEQWVVRSYVLMVDATDNNDMADYGLGFARESVDSGYQMFERELRFETELRGILESIRPWNGKLDLNPGKLAHLLAATGRAFEASARSVEELRELIDGMLKVVLAAAKGPGCRD